MGFCPCTLETQLPCAGLLHRYFSIADTPFLPEYLLLPYVGTEQYIFYDTLLFYAVGFIGLLLIYRKFKLSPFAFSLVFMIFNFNGSLTSHLAVGHSIEPAIFCSPTLSCSLSYWLSAKRLAGAQFLAWWLFMLFILATGYFHLYLWCLMFLGLLAVFNWRLIKPVFWLAFLRFSPVFPVFCLLRLPYPESHRSTWVVSFNHRYHYGDGHAARPTSGRPGHH